MVKTVGEKLFEMKTLFEKAGMESAFLDAVLLLAGAMGVHENQVRLYPDKILENETLIDVFTARRLKKEPVSKILNVKGFWKDDFYVNENVLDPRPDSETLIESVLNCFQDKTAPLHILDLGTGSGCLILSLLKEYENASGFGVDFSQKALDIAVKNARTLLLSERFAPLCASWEDGDFATRFNQPFDVIVANPPYIDESERETLPQDTLFDPPEALFAKENGLKAYRDIASVLPRLLKENGTAFFECGINQAQKLASIFETAGLRVVKIRKDLAQIDRCVCVRV